MITEEPTITESWETALRSDGYWWFWVFRQRKWHGPYGSHGVAILRAKKECGN